MSKAKRKKSKPTPKKKKQKPTRRTSTRVNWANLSIRQAAASLSNLIGKETGEAILVGAACAAIYASKRRAKSIDFVVKRYHVEKMIVLMEQHGFARRELRSFIHPKAKLEVSFPPPPLVVGDEMIRKTNRLRSSQGDLHLLTPTDCVRHRLAAWYRWDDEDAFQQAVEVAKRHLIDFDLVKRWSEWEWATEKCEQFLQALESKE